MAREPLPRTRGELHQSLSMPDHVTRPASSSLRSTPLTTTTRDPAMKLTFDGPADGTELVRSLTGSSPPSTIEVRFDPASPSETLSGLPSGWCNTPSVGQPLIYNVPVTVSGITSGNLEVAKSPSGINVRIPIKVKHNL